MIVLPILLMLVGGALDFGRVFYVDLKVQSATRNAAEYIATNSAFNNCQSCADFKASYLICSEMTGSADCTGATNPPRISVTLKPPKTSWPGTPRSPIVTVTVRVEQDFDMLFPYPFMSPPGRWTLVHESTFSVAQNR